MIDTDDYGSQYDAMKHFVGEDANVIVLDPEHPSMPNHVMYENGDGDCENARATALAGECSCGVSHLVRGDVIVAGPADEDGAETAYGTGLDVMPDLLAIQYRWGTEETERLETVLMGKLAQIADLER